MAEAGSDQLVRVRIDVAYDGTGFSGWASQPGRRTVQETLEAALTTILRLPPDGCPLTVAGRTDTGVHARGQVCHADIPLTDPGLSLERLRARLARLLPDDVVVRRLAAVPPAFDARFSALSRRYAYRVCDRPDSVDPLRRHEVVTWPRPLDEDLMNEASRVLVGEHDFAAFCKRREGASTVRELRTLAWSRRADLMSCSVVADAFCHHMVRSLVGCLVVIGERRRPPAWAGEVLAAGVRDSGVPVLPAGGLTLEAVEYPPDADLAARAVVTRMPRRPAGRG